MPKNIVRIADIKVKDRFREDFGDIESLAVSIQRYGLLHPIILSRDMELIAGERRLKAHLMLKVETIEVKFIDEADALEKKEIEIEENIKRKDFLWQEQVKATAEIDTIKRKLYGGAVKGYGGGWGQKQTAQSLGTSIGSVSQDLQLAEAVKKFPELAKEKNKSHAWKKYQKMQERAIRQEMTKRAKKRAPEKIDNILTLGDCRPFLRKILDGSVDLICTDPQYGVGIQNANEFKKVGHEMFADDKEETMELLVTVFAECFRILKDNRHAYFFFSLKHYTQIRTMLEEAGFFVEPEPIIWNKTSLGAGIGKYNYCTVYESIFHCMKGQRDLNKVLPNLFTIDRVPPRKKLHPTEKPVSLLKKLIENSTIPDELVVEPFAGSGSTLQACIELGRKVKGWELSEVHYNAAVTRLESLLK